MKIAVDRNQFAGSHGLSNMEKHIQIERMGHELVSIPLQFGDYCILNDDMQETINRRGKNLKKSDTAPFIKVCVDAKKNIQEIVGNICGKTHARFRDEIILSKAHGCKMYVLIENMDDVKSIDDLEQWHNPRLDMKKWIITPSGERRKVPKYPTATKGETLAKAMRTMQDKYSCEFLFCSPEESGAMVLELLGKEV